MGLGTGRRGMKSPPLLIAVLLACVFVLGINYWITSSRCVELQNRVIELESRMRRAAAERGAVELKKNEYEDMLTKQKKQIDTIQSLHSSQLQNAHSQCNREKDSLLNNLTEKDSVVQTLQIQNSNIYKGLEECKMELKDLQESQTKKLSYELAQCSSKITEVKEQCEERLRKAGVKDTNAVNEENLEKIITEAEKPKPTTKQEVKQEIDDKKKEEQLKNNIKVEIVTPSKNEKKEAVLPSGNVESNVVEPNAVEKKPSATPQMSKKEDDKADNVQEPENPINPDIADVEEENEEPKVEDAEDNEVERENFVRRDDQQEDDQAIKLKDAEENAEDPNDYNGDEANVAEPEAEKQAQLIDNNHNLKDDKPPNGQKEQAADQEAEDSESPVEK